MDHLACVDLSSTPAIGHGLNANRRPARIATTRRSVVLAQKNAAFGWCRSSVGRHACNLQTRSRFALKSASGDAMGMPKNENIIDDTKEEVGKVFAHVVLPTSLVLLLCNMDRVCLSIAMLPISKQFGWAEGIQGMVQSAFLWGYTATQVLGGSLADQYGGKVVMGLGVAWFSFASLLLPFALSQPFQSLGLVIPAALMARFFVGFGEGVTMPAMNNLISRCVPARLKATALGGVFLGFHCGNFVGLVLSSWLVVQYGWQSVFYTFGILGLPLLYFWSRIVPSQDNFVEGKSSMAPTSIREILSNKASWAVILATVVNHWGYFICLNWMPTYFYKAMGLNLRSSGYFSIVPWLVMAMGSITSGIFADSIISAGVPVLVVRRAMQSIAFVVPGLACLTLADPTISSKMALICFTVALAAKSLGQAGFVANSSDIARKNAGKLYGVANMCGSFSGLVGTWAVGIIVEKTQSFASVFQITALVYLLGTIAWNSLSTTEQVFD